MLNETYYLFIFFINKKFLEESKISFYLLKSEFNELILKEIF